MGPLEMLCFYDRDGRLHSGLVCVYDNYFKATSADQRLTVAPEKERSQAR